MLTKYFAVDIADLVGPVDVAGSVDLVHLVGMVDVVDFVVDNVDLHC